MSPALRLLSAMCLVPPLVFPRVLYLPRLFPPDTSPPRLFLCYMMACLTSRLAIICVEFCNSLSSFRLQLCLQLTEQAGRVKRQLQKGMTRTAEGGGGGAGIPPPTENFEVDIFFDTQHFISS